MTWTSRAITRCSASRSTPTGRRSACHRSTTSAPTSSATSRGWRRTRPWPPGRSRRTSTWCKPARGSCPTNAASRPSWWRSWTPAHHRCTWASAACAPRRASPGWPSRRSARRAAAHSSPTAGPPGPDRRPGRLLRRGRGQPAGTVWRGGRRRAPRRRRHDDDGRRRASGGGSPMGGPAILSRPRGRHRHGTRRYDSDHRVPAALRTVLTPETRARATAVAGTIRTNGTTVVAKLLLDMVSQQNATSVRVTTPDRRARGCPVSGYTANSACSKRPACSAAAAAHQPTHRIIVLGVLSRVAARIACGFGYRAPVRRYRDVMVDSARWERFTFRPGDVVISTPSKCGTTWMQTIVGMLLLDRVDLGAPISTISPWLDMLIRTDDEVFGLLEPQTHRRFIKTHTPLDGVPRHDEVTYIAVIRHPLDVALSNADHFENERAERAIELRTRAAGPPDLPEQGLPFHDLAGYLRWFIDNDVAPTGSGPNGLADYCEQIRTYWDAREAPNVPCSTTPTCGPSVRARCDGSPRCSACPSTRTGGRRSSKPPGSSRCGPAPTTPHRRRTWGCGGIRGPSSGRAGPATGHR